MKIHIIGGSGSGKTFLAKKLSKEYNLPHYDLDDIMWDNQSDTYGVKRDIEERKKLGVERGKKETLKSLCNLLKWADEYQEKDMVQIRKILVPYSDKVIEK